MANRQQGPNRHLHPAWIILYSTLVAILPTLLQIGVMSFAYPDMTPNGIGYAVVLLAMPSAACGFGLGLFCLVFWRIVPSPPHSWKSYVRSLIVGMAAGAIGAYPIGWLGTSTTLMTDLGIGHSVGILAAGLYIATLFAGFMLCWELRRSPGPLEPV